ncbi:hypothetical protein NE237_031562 [Protea cynaroides]|uniref:Uncharacterized protein n=1 Tax=Protea cynaroides TaxID=273540 RepID=A0A9Q0R282_9MAGN|nr:hypothetical protein NE237_031562 [Protea cynaroides]
MSLFYVSPLGEDEGKPRRGKCESEDVGEDICKLQSALTGVFLGEAVIVGGEYGGQLLGRGDQSICLKPWSLRQERWSMGMQREEAADNSLLLSGRFSPTSRGPCLEV